MRYSANTTAAFLVALLATLATWRAAHGDMVVGHESLACSGNEGSFAFFDSVEEACSTRRIMSYTLESEDFQACHACVQPPPPPPPPPGTAVRGCAPLAVLNAFGRDQGGSK